MARLLHRKSSLISKNTLNALVDSKGYSGEISYSNPSKALEQLKRLKPSEVEDAITDYISGTSVQTIADKIGVSRQTVSKMLADHQVERRRGALNSRQIDELIAGRERGLTLQQIANQLGLSLSTVKRRARELRP
jgi:DNA invertase Pin-like site-specific DNA recombinase